MNKDEWYRFFLILTKRKTTLKHKLKKKEVQEKKTINP
jgi:hypothetical protein